MATRYERWKAARAAGYTGSIMQYAKDETALLGYNAKGPSNTHISTNVGKQVASGSSTSSSTTRRTSSTSSGTSRPSGTGGNDQYKNADRNAAKSTNAAKYRIRQIYKNRGLTPPSGSKLNRMAQRAKADNGDFFDIVRRNPQNYISSSSSSSGGSSGRSSGGSSGKVTGGVNYTGEYADNAASNDATAARARILQMYTNAGLTPPSNAKLDRMVANVLRQGGAYLNTIRQNLARYQDNDKTGPDANTGNAGGDNQKDSTGTYDPTGGDAAAIAGGSEAVAARITEIFENRGLDVPANLNALVEKVLRGEMTLNEVRGIAEYGVQQEAEEAERRATANVNARAVIDKTLEDYGLGELSQWAWEAIQRGDPISKILIDLREQGAYKKRFKGLEIRRENGLSAMTEEEYINYELRAQALMRGANLPEGFYDKHDDFAELIGKNVTLDQLSRRINQGYREVQNAPQEVRRVFQEYFGANGDSALASFFLDPERAESFLSDAVETAQVGGAGLRFGLEIDKSLAQKIQKLKQGQANVENAFGTINRLKPLFQETISESKDFTAEREGINAFLNVDDPDASAKLEKRLATRKAAFSPNIGGAAVTNSGAIGFGGVGG